MSKKQQNGLLILAIATVTEFAGLFLWVKWVDENKIVLGILGGAPHFLFGRRFHEGTLGFCV